MNDPLFLGIDGGGTACKARLCGLAGNVLAESRSGPANTLLGIENAMAAMTQAAAETPQRAGLSETNLGRIVAGAGLAGLSLERERRRILAQPHPFGAFTAEADAHVACLGAHAGGNGGILIVGTGTCAYAIVDDKIHTAGGWGFALSDQGSAADLGRSALKRALNEIDGVYPESELGGLLAGKFEGSPEEMVIWAESATPKDYGQFAPVVIAQAEIGDQAALELVTQTAGDVERLANALFAKGAPKISIAGGLAEPLTPYLSAGLREKLVPRQGDALDGALILARRQYKDNPVDA